MGKSQVTFLDSGIIYFILLFLAEYDWTFTTDQSQLRKKVGTV